MFDFSQWVVSGIVDGYENGLTPFSKVTELTANYLIKGIITQSQADEIAEKCPLKIEESENVENQEN